MDKNTRESVNIEKTAESLVYNNDWNDALHVDSGDYQVFLPYARMDKNSREFVNFEKTAESRVNNNDWNDAFHLDGGDYQVILPHAQRPLPEIPKIENKTVEIEFTEAEPIQSRADGHTIEVCLNSLTGSSIYQPEPDGFICDPMVVSPIKARSITDICCFMLFFSLLTIWIFSTWLVITNVKLDGGNSQPCGVGNLLDKPYEYNFNLFKCFDQLVAFRTCTTKSICVEECPNTSFTFSHYRMHRYNPSGEPTNDLTDSIQCIGDTKNTLYTMADVEKYIEEDQCEEITRKSFNLGFKCVPDILETEIHYIINLLDNIIPQTNILWGTTYELTKLFNNIWKSYLNHSKMYTFSNMVQRWPVSIVFIIVAMILTLVLVYSMRFLAVKYIFIIFKIFNAIILVGSIYVCYTRGYVFEEYSFSLFKNDIWGLSLVFTTMVSLIFLVPCSIGKRALIIGELIKDTTNAIQNIKTLLIFPLILLCVRAGAVILSIYIGFSIKSISVTDYKFINRGRKSDLCYCNGYEDGGFCNPNGTRKCMLHLNPTYCDLECKPVIKHISYDRVVNFAQFTNLWASEYLYLLEYAILSSIFATYYWTFRKRDIPTFTSLNGFWTTVRYHLGTILFASSLCRFILPAIDTVLGFWPPFIMLFFFKYVVILTSLRGDNFYGSAKGVIRILAKNVRLIIISQIMAEVLFFYLKLLITVVMGGLMLFVVLYIRMVNHDYFQQDIFPVYIVCMGTYLITTEIFNIFILGVNTFTICFIEDVSINNGEATSPYFMSRELMKICKLKNKFDT